MMKKKPLRSYSTIAEFCARKGVSRSTFYELDRAGLAPKTVKIGRARRIPDDAEREWDEWLANGGMESQKTDEGPPKGGKEPKGTKNDDGWR